MRLSEQYNQLIELKEYINKKLVEIDFQGVKELVLDMAKSESYQRHKGTDNQIIALDFFLGIWMRENSDIYEFAHQGDIFCGVNSLEDIERKYLIVEFGVFRIENEMPLEYINEAVDAMLNNKVSAYAMFCVVLREARKRNQEDIILKLARILKQKNELMHAIGLLQVSTEEFKTNKEMFLELADCWLMVREMEKAYECLKHIENPDNEIENMIVEMEMVLGNENI